MGSFRNTVLLLRIPFSFYLMPLFLFALSQAQTVYWHNAAWSFVIIHLLMYPASNGYNSYVDRDEGSIGGLENPPLPTIQLFYLTLFMDLLALILGVIFVNILFSASLLLYILASRAYSSPQIRLKKYPIPGFLTVTVFQGAFTYIMSTVGITGEAPALSTPNIWIWLGCSFQIGGAYPLTQVYQHKQDLKDGVVSLSYRLGYRGTFCFTGLMFLFCTICYFQYFNRVGQPGSFYSMQLFFLPIIVYFGYWFNLVWSNANQADFTNTMRMNKIAALCMNSCFLCLLAIQHIP